MMRSMFSGVSGLQAHQTKMDVIGNNVANVNTVGFKSSRVTFQEVFSQTLKGASSPDPTTGRGGTNPMQVGLGLGVATIDTLMTRGSVQRTDNPTDLAIEGDGFFIVKGGSSDTFKFTRAGNFGIDRLGNLVTGSGLNVYGWQSYTKLPDGTYKFDTESQIEPINLYSDDVNKNKRMIAAKATTYAIFEGNLDASYSIYSSAASGTSSNNRFTMPVTVYDSLGNSYKINISFWKTDVTGGVTTWTWQVDSGNGVTASGATGTILFDDQGQVIESSAVTPSITIIPDSSVGSQNINVKLDFSRLTMYAADSSAKATNVDGYPAGSLVTFSIGSDGMIMGIYSNGQQQPLGLIALASFDNPAGLEKVGENMYIPTSNSGEFKKGVKAGTEGVGTLSPGTLEMSNVDLSKEFTEMIITQRGFQANSRIITTSDEMLQELVNLKR
ncbi:MAG TPA: flagellar hook protein FlgE [Hungateiclostridium thermocellum]|uniref:Flagellar hook protein FlgE n=2 Tax=Acetivibrio thermocellus TaxID=1515 RepID=A3DCN3_ACET2|nr:flagellar hook protein FlgE [Acetivibrio thermocellus]CDG35188.1 Flagellar hook protein FlgE [Acetivibrio thermocellus BC1]ABN51712.1 flagellar hook-basal body protein [Acetivibrio thermocellus ATCC 27405]ADU74803.1 flagellar hook-basal body protein [Acetivibrio thermocellus DSM 1313]ALX08756.1 flagellar hook-basal body protein [Acetivibrio thermocellus AD2]ANV76507.1 flagellar hook-basal body protein [Acetivibrio thermocellus DSM 2360]